MDLLARVKRIHLIANHEDLGLQMNRAVHELFKARLGKGSFEFDSGTKRVEPESQF